MIRLGDGFLGHIRDDPGKAVELGLSKRTGETTRPIRLRSRPSVDQKVGALYVRSGSKGAHTKVGTGILYYREGRIGVKRGHASHDVSYTTAFQYVGRQVTLYVQLKLK